LKRTAPFASIPLGDSTGLQVGEWVLAIGNPFGLAALYLGCIVSAKERRDLDAERSPGLYDFIQDRCLDQPRQFGRAVDQPARRGGRVNAAVNASGQGPASRCRSTW